MFCPCLQELHDLTHTLFDMIEAAVEVAGSPDLRLACQAVNPRDALGRRVRPPAMRALASPGYWRRVKATVTEPLAASLARPAAAEEEGDPSKDAALGVQLAEALATRPCAHVACTAIEGASEACQPRGKRCSGCRLVHYCGAGCQKADWPAHKAACQVLQRTRREG